LKAGGKPKIDLGIERRGGVSKEGGVEKKVVFKTGTWKCLVEK